MNANAPTGYIVNKSTYQRLYARLSSHCCHVLPSAVAFTCHGISSALHFTNALSLEND
jgi:hypothetical protein